jgi:chromosome segregation and condensation protein ScpB
MSASTRAQDEHKVEAALAGTEAPLTVSEVSQVSGLPVGGAYRAMRRLKAKGRVEEAGVALNGGTTWRRAGGA